MKRRRFQAQAIAELPAGIMLLLVGFFVPLVIMASFFYRMYMFHGVVKQSAVVGAAQQDFATAKAQAASFITTHGTNGFSVSAPTVTLLKRSVAYTDGSGNKGTYDTYYLQVVATGTISPLLKMQSFFGTSVPGLTADVPMGSTEAVYFENQDAAAAAYSGS